MTLFHRQHLLMAPNDDGAGGGGDDDADRGDSFAGKDDDDELADIVASTKDESEADKAAREAKEAEVAAEKDKAQAAEVAKKHQLVPQARMKEAVEKERAAREAAEARLKAAEDKLRASEKTLDPEAVEAEIGELEAQVDQAVADGDKAKAADLRKQIRGKMQALATAEATQRAAHATAMAVEQVRYDAAVATLEAAHPVMNPDSDQYDEAVVAEITELKGAYEATGMGSTDALRKAAKYVFKVAPEAAKQEIKDEETPEEKKAREAEEKTAAKATADAAAKAKEEAIRRGAAARQAQPPRGEGRTSNKDGQVLSVGKMSDKDFEKLTDEERARLRGDSL
jgi:colicin import membrane protein